jgi:hypothetical protein
MMVSKGEKHTHTHKLPLLQSNDDDSMRNGNFIVFELVLMMTI